MEKSSGICQEPSATLMSDVHEDWVGITNAAEEFGTKQLLPPSDESISEKDTDVVGDCNLKNEANSPPQGILKTPFKLSGLNISATKETLHRMWFGYNQTEDKEDCKNTECCEIMKPTPATENSILNATKGAALLQRIGFGRDFNEGKGCKTKDFENKEPRTTDDAGIKKAVDWSQTKEAIQRLSATLTTTAAARAEPVRRS